MDLDKLASGIVLAAISALTFLAYKHPSAYKPVCILVTVIMTCALVGSMLWDMSAGATYVRLLPLVRPDQIDAATAVTDKAKILNGFHFFLYAVIGGYLNFLWFLPQLLHEKKPVQPQNEEKDG